MHLTKIAFQGPGIVYNNQKGDACMFVYVDTYIHTYIHFPGSCHRV